MSTCETAYTEDDTPRRFKELLQQSTTTKSKNTTASSSRDGTSKVDDEWTVRPGESFREFNARIRQSGLTVPPGVSEATRYPREFRNELPVRETLPVKRFAAPELSDSAVVPGERTKQKRKEYLKQRREAKKLKKRQTQVSTDENDADDDTRSASDISNRRASSGSHLHTRDVVQAPPALKVIPKATLKMNQRRSPHQKNPSLLPLLRATKHIE